jgi:hypothetical protein
MRSIHIIAASAIAFLLSGCMTYNYGDRAFNDRKEAEAAQRADMDLIKAGIKPRISPVAKSGRVVILSKALVLDRGLNEGGAAEGRDYIATTALADMRNTAELIRNRKIFERLEIDESSDGAHVIPKSGEAVIYFYLPDRNTGGWYYISEATKRTPLHFDKGNPDKVGRHKYFIDSVEALAAGESR